MKAFLYRPAIMEDNDDVTIPFGAEDEPVKKQFKHPFVVLFHLIFRTSAILVYMFFSWFISSFVVNFVVIVVLLAMDFWTVKNVSGRLLAGLRWWNYIDEDGNSHWVYEASKKTNKYSATEIRLFWMTLIIYPVIWCAFLFVTLFRLEFAWFMVVLVSLILNGANLFGYVRCKIGNKQKLSSIATNFLGQQMFRNVSK